VRTPRLSLPLLLAVAGLLALALVHTAEIRQRAEDGLGRGMAPREAALARGFVLGDDEALDEATREDFVRSGLSHLTAVSGENVTLLALLASVLLGALGIPLRDRLVWILAAIVLYVPLAGSGPSIQRAGVMGAAGLLATLAGRRASTLYALALALLVTLAVDPSVAGDVGWQLSFAAVLGIWLLAGRIRDALLARGGDRKSPWRRALAEGAGVTVAATLATAPLVAYYFGEASLTSLAANLLAMPAVAPAMWLGMLSAALAQVPGVPLEPLNGLDALLLAYVAQVAHWCAAPSWAVVGVHLGPGGVAAAYAAIAAAAVAAIRLSRARRLAAARALGIAPAAGDGAFVIGRADRDKRRTPLWSIGRRCGGPQLRRRPWAALAAALGLAALAGALALHHASSSAEPPRPYGLRVSVLDVGQGDAILLQPAAAPAVLVDGGPPGDGLEAQLEDAGVTSLGAAIVSHDQSDHAGGIDEILGRFPVAHLVLGVRTPRLIAEAAAAHVPALAVARGRTIRSGSLRLEVLWPPPELAAEPPPGTDPNDLALVLLARWHRFRMLLTADAEAETVPIDPGPVDVLKVAHHGSDDAGLPALLDRTRPRLAVISVGAGNPFGHPTPGTLAVLARHRVRTLRTDRDGTVEIDVTDASVRVHSDG
jgi:competence protein ComEC